MVPGLMFESTIFLGRRDLGLISHPLTRLYDSSERHPEYPLQFETAIDHANSSQTPCSK